MGALVGGFKAFLSPQLGPLLQLLFTPRLLACKEAGCSEAAAAIRIQLAAVIPPRLLLAPLFGFLDAALQASLLVSRSMIHVCSSAVVSETPCCLLDIAKRVRSCSQPQRRSFASFS